MNLASLLLQADAPKWTDVGGFIATSAGVVVTFAAVLVALFGPRWQANRSQPKLSLSVEPAGLEWTVGEVFGAQPMILLLHNAEGRDTAVDVEVFAYVTRRSRLLACDPLQSVTSTFTGMVLPYLNMLDG